MGTSGDRNHGSRRVQSFPDANHLLDDLWKAEKEKRKAAGDENPDRNDFFKVIYGCEAYLVDDLKEIVTGDKGQVLRDSYVVFDIETTGFSPVKNRIIEIGAVEGGGRKDCGQVFRLCQSTCADSVSN